MFLLYVEIVQYASKSVALSNTVTCSLQKYIHNILLFLKSLCFPDHANILKQLPFNKKAPKKRDWWEHLAISFTQTCRQWRQVKEWGWLHAGRKWKNPVNQNEILGLTLPTRAERREAWGQTPLSWCCLTEQISALKTPFHGDWIKRKSSKTYPSFVHYGRWCDTTALSCTTCANYFKSLNPSCGGEGIWTSLSTCCHNPGSERFMQLKVSCTDETSLFHVEATLRSHY